MNSEIMPENIHIRELFPLLSPDEVKHEHPASAVSLKTAAIGRNALHNLLTDPNQSDRLVAIIGPCSVDNPDAALEYAEWAAKQRSIFSDKLEIIMRVYFEKPRTTVGWKGLINDPGLDESFDINRGLLTARKLLCDITSIGLPVASELLDTMTPQYFSDLLSWGAIGARTVESQLHRELASGLSFPIGFKNGTGGDTQVAVDAVCASRQPHHFPAITSSGRIAIARTSGNPDGHVVLRGGKKGPNFDAVSVAEVSSKLISAGLLPKILIDASHANSNKDHKRQIEVVKNISSQVALGSTSILGVMIESNLKEGNQSFRSGERHEYGLSITDACVNLEDTRLMLESLARSLN